MRRLKSATVRRTSPEVLAVAKTLRWTPEQVLHTLIEAELTARDASNAANRLEAAAFPVTKNLDSFEVSASSIPQATFDYLSSLEWVRAQHNLTFIGPPGTGKSDTLIGLGHAAVTGRPQSRYLTATDLLDTSTAPGRQHRRQNHRQPATRGRRDPLRLPSGLVCWVATRRVRVPT